MAESEYCDDYYEYTNDDCDGDCMKCKTDCPCNVNGECTWVANYETCKSKTK